MKELRHDKKLIDHMNIDSGFEGRGAITGTVGTHVWDYLQLKGAEGMRFTQYPHLTIGIHDSRVDAMLTFPHHLKTELRKNLTVKKERFREIVLDVTSGIEKTFRGIDGIVPQMRGAQRRWPHGQRAPSVSDAEICFDPRTVLSQNDHKIRCQPQWLDAIFEAIKAKKSNLQFQIGAVFKYDECSVLKNSESINLLVNAFIAGKPLLDLATF